MTIEILVIIILALVIGSLLIEKQFLIKQYHEEKNKLLEELSRATKAVIAKNANDYVMTTSIDKVPAEEPAPANPDLVDEQQLSDDEFMKAINKQVE